MNVFPFMTARLRLSLAPAKKAQIRLSLAPAKEARLQLSLAPVTEAQLRLSLAPAKEARLRLPNTGLLPDCPKYKKNYRFCTLCNVKSRLACLWLHLWLTGLTTEPTHSNLLLRCEEQHSNLCLGLQERAAGAGGHAPRTGHHHHHLTIIFTI